jgi:hypothetical protein
MEIYQLIHLFLQSIRIPINMKSFDTEFPISIYVFNVQKFNNDEYNFDFRDDVNFRTVFVRLDDIGILASFDAGAQAVEGKKFFGKYLDKSLHPLQFEELGANLFYKASLFNRNPKVIIQEFENEITIHHMPIAGMSMKPVFRQWNHEAYAHCLSLFTGFPIEFIQPNKNQNQTMTWLENEKDEFMFLNIRDYPYRGYE